MLRTNEILRLSNLEKACGYILKRYNSGKPDKGPKTVERFKGFSYYRRFPDKEDPPIVPAKLFMVQLFNSTFGTPWWDRKRLNALGLNPLIDRHGIVIVKNNPENCAALWKVKHLVRITPITFPNGEPSREDLGATYLNTQGQLLVSEKHKVDPAEKQAELDYVNNERRLDLETKKRDSIYKWGHGYDLD